MSIPFLSQRSPWFQLFWLVLAVISSLGMASFLSLVAIKLMYGIDVLDIQAFLANDKNENYLSVLRLMQVFQAIGGFILPAMFFAQFYTGNALDVEGLFEKPMLIQSIAGVVLVFCLQPFINFLAEWNAALPLPEAFGISAWMKESEASAARITEVFLKMDSVSDLLFTLFMIGVLAALGEEFLFRGTLQPIALRIFHNQHLAIWITAFLFSAMHMQFLGFFPRFLLGAVLGYAAWWGQSLWLPILIHFANNGAAVLVSYLVQHEVVPKEWETTGTDGDYALVLASLVLSVGLLFGIKKTAPRDL